MDQWLKEGLSKILNFEIPEEMLNYILSIEAETDFNEYMNTLLDLNNSQHKDFFMELCKRKFPNRVNSVPRQKKKISKNTPTQEFNGQESEIKAKKKTKYVNLYSQEGRDAQVVMLKGRHHCDCEASKHDLINNCLNCGRIVCKQEGSGPCLFCGTLVCTAEEEQQINTQTKAGRKLKEALSELTRPKGWEEALAHRNKLLEYDRNSEQRTRVIDDDSDYFKVDSVWLSANERDRLQQYQQELHEKKHESRRNKKMTFDFAGRQVVEDKTIEHLVDEDKIREIMGSGTATSKSVDDNVLVDAFPSHVDKFSDVNAQFLQFDPFLEGEGYATAIKSSGQPMSNISRVQDAELMEMVDTGRCLSMHQPWASLLVEGIKLHEGRTWYSNHRGRLWIASTVKPPDQELVKSLENQYTVLYPEKNFKFPSFYPTGCLLGCVNVDDVLPQEEYQKIYPGGESDSPYVFICSNPISLRLRFPMKGSHKIYCLDKNIHKAAVKSLQNMAKLPTQEVNAG